MAATTIKLHGETKSALDQFREYKNESYDEVIQKVLYIAKNVQKRPQLSKDTLKAIEQARKRMRTGDFLTEDQARARLGL